MIPPTSIDGTDITGATIDGTDVQEITVDGDTVFELSALPNSAIHQYKMDEGSGTVANDAIGSNDGTINGASFVSDSNLVGGFGLDFDSDTIDLSTDNQLKTDTDWSLAITVDIDNLSHPDAAGNGVVWAQSTSTNDRWAFGYNGSNYAARIIGLNGDTTAGTSVSPNTGQKERIGISYDSSAVSLEWYVNGSDVTSGTISQSIQPDAAQVIGGDSRGINNVDDIVMDNAVAYDKVLTSSEWQQDYDAQPWS